MAVANCQRSAVLKPECAHTQRPKFNYPIQRRKSGVVANVAFVFYCLCSPAAATATSTSTAAVAVAVAVSVATNLVVGW